jgi:hypothetical protein
MGKIIEDPQGDLQQAERLIGEELGLSTMRLVMASSTLDVQTEYRIMFDTPWFTVDVSYISKCGNERAYFTYAILNMRGVPVLGRHLPENVSSEKLTASIVGHAYLYMANPSKYNQP